MSKTINLDVVYSRPPNAASGRTTVRICDIRRVSSVPSYEHSGSHTCVKMEDGSSLYVKQHESTVTAALEESVSQPAHLHTEINALPYTFRELADVIANLPSFDGRCQSSGRSIKAVLQAAGIGLLVKDYQHATMIHEDLQKDLDARDDLHETVPFLGRQLIKTNPELAVQANMLYEEVCQWRNNATRKMANIEAALSAAIEGRTALVAAVKHGASLTSGKVLPMFATNNSTDKWVVMLDGFFQFCDSESQANLIYAKLPDIENSAFGSMSVVPPKYSVPHATADVSEANPCNIEGLIEAVNKLTS